MEKQLGFSKFNLICMSAAKPRVPVSVIVVNWKTPDLTCKALIALYNSTVIPEQVIMVDNASGDETVARVRHQFPDVIILENQENVGFAKANNQAIRTVVNQPYVWLLNSDTETGPQSLAQLVEYVVANPRVGAVGPQLVYPTRAWQSVGGFFPTPTNVLYYLIPLTWFLPAAWRRRLHSLALYPQPIPETGLKLDYVTGAAVLLRRAALDEVGLLAEEYFMYFEETDLCWRLHQAGWGRHVIPTDPVMHVYGGSYKTAFDPRRLRRMLDSLLLFVTKNYRGARRSLIVGEIKLLGSLSLVLKRFKNIV